MQSKNISLSLLKKYVDYAVSMVIAHYDTPLENSEEYDDRFFKSIGAWAKKEGHQEILLIGIDYLISNPTIDTTVLQSNEYPWDDDDEIRQILQEIRKRLWPDTPMTSSDILQNVVLTND